MQKLSSLLALLCVSIFCCAQNYTKEEFKDMRTVQGRIVDYVTSLMPDSTTRMEVLSEDSVHVANGYVNKNEMFYGRNMDFFVNVRKAKKYILKFTNPLYHDLYVPLTVENHKRERAIDMGVVRMRRKLASELQHLPEVEVRATKVKFYFNKDTLVYNADAFVTQKGFALNDILRKMPGLEIHDNGEIFANGRKVSALLLNGKDFFNRDRKTLLDNLPAFMVKDVQLYEKTKDSLSLFRREREFQGYVMDVKLKKEYQSSQLGSVNIGGGTSGRYDLSAIGIKFNSIHRVSAYGAYNDVNRTNTPTGFGDMMAFNLPNGDFKNAMGGLSYDFDNPRGLFATSGDLTANYWDETNWRRTALQSIYDTGDVFSRMRLESGRYTFRLTTSHTLDLFSNTAYDFVLKPTFSFTDRHSKGFSRGVSFDSDADSLWGAQWADSIMSDELTRTLATYGINRNRTRNKENNRTLKGSVALSKEIKIPHTDDVLRLSGSYAYTDQKDETFSHRYIEYLRTGQTDFQNRYGKNTTRTNEWHGNADYQYSLTRHSSLSLCYAYNHLGIDNNSPLYSLHQLAGWDSHNGASLGILPSQEKMLSVIDGNSQSYTQHDNEHLISLNYSKNLQSVIGDRHYYTAISASLPFRLMKRTMDFQRPMYDTVVSRSICRPDFSLSAQVSCSNPNSRDHLAVAFSYNLSNQMPSLYNLIDITNDANPLYVTHGNPHLKDSKTHNLSGSIAYQMPSGINHALKLSYKVDEDLVANAQAYDRTTGITHVMPRNVNGNYTFGATLTNGWDFGAGRRRNLSNELKMTWDRNVDYMSTDLTADSKKSSVRNFNLSENLSGKYSTADTKLNLSASAYLNYTHSSGSWLYSMPRNFWSFGLKGNMTWELGKNFRLSTEAYSVSRRGHSDSSMNDDELIWNATLTKSFSEKLSLKLEGYDILNQRKMVIRYVNAQGCEETYYNALRRYVMLHLTYRFSFSPKHKR